MIFPYFATCTCPITWNGVVPPPCPVHNPQPPYITWTSANLDIATPKRKKRKKRRK